MNLRFLGWLVAASFLTRAFALTVPILDVDEAAHLVGSWVLAGGGVPYVDFVDNKPPLLYVYYWLAQLVFGRGLSAVRIFTALVTIPVTAYALFSFFQYDRRGRLAALLYVVYSGAYLAHDMLAVAAEVPMLLPASWALVLVAVETPHPALRRRFTAGLLIGIAFLIKYQAALWLPALALTDLALGRHRLRRCLALGLGALLPLLATGAVFSALGAAGPLFHWTLAVNFIYTANPISGHEAAGRAVATLLPWTLATLPLWWLWLAGRGGLDPRRRLLVAGLIPLSFAAAALGFRFFPHYLIQLYPPLALGAAPLAAESLRRPLARGGRLLLAHAAFVLAGFTLANTVLYHGPWPIYREALPVYDRVAARLRADACFRGARLFVWGWAPMFHVSSGLLPASRFAVLPQSGLTTYVAGNLESLDDPERRGRRVDPESWQTLFADLERSHATYVLDTAPAALFRWDHQPVSAYPEFETYLREHYQPLDVVDRVIVYRRRGCAPGAESR